MNKKTAEALEKSIQKWQKIAAREGQENGVADCALCALFWVDDCRGCPVMKRTGMWGCQGTPYIAWSRLSYENPQTWGRSSEYTNRMIAVAREEIAFLESLREKSNG